MEMLFGFVLGCVTMMVVYRIWVLGVLHINNYDPEEEPYMFLELDKDADEIASYSYVILKVNSKGFDSSK